MKWAVFFGFLIFAFGLTIRAFLIKFAKQPEQTPEEKLDRERFNDAVNASKKMQKHQHQWRQITEFVRQCRIRECSDVEITDNVPDGMAEYVDLMTTRDARMNPKREACLYPTLDSRNWGPKCPQCNRVIGAPEDIARSPFDGEFERNSSHFCPYCQAEIVYILDAGWITKPDESNHS